MKNTAQLDPAILEKAQSWLSPDFDEVTRKEVQEMIDKDPSGLTDAFYKDLEFGTGGLRGVMGAGSNKMNVYTVGMATQGLANYIIEANGDTGAKVAIAHDSRNNSRLFAQTAADVLSANGLEVFLFEDLRPTPELSFAVRELGCQAGIVITASHNPKEYNGYKVYWDDGGQLVPPHDARVIEKVREIGGPKDVKFEGDPSRIRTLGAEMDQKYWSRIQELSLGNAGKSDIKIVFTNIHGTGVMGVPQVLERMGFDQVQLVKEQQAPDGNFPTVHSPNPEEAAALDMAIKLADESGADLVLGTDPDSDRVGVAARNSSGQMILMNGNETAAVLIWYYLSSLSSQGKLKDTDFVAKTIVTSDLLADIAEHFNVRVYECLTGFKYIAEMIREKEGKEHYLIGGEESYGYLIDSFVRDKDAISSAAMIAETAAWAKSQGKSLIDLLEEIHHEISLYQEELISITKKGKKGAEEISQMMTDFRSKRLPMINGFPVVITRDFQSSIEKDLRNGEERVINLPKSNVFQFILHDQSVITARPSGTEPKIKFYISVREKIHKHETHGAMRVKQAGKIRGIKTALGLD